jgi:transcriptional regulator of arginine metabolism
MKAQRHNTIRELLAKAPIASQDELRRKLAERAVHVTQATLSRDIHDMRLSKGPSGYSLPPTVSEADDLPGIRDILSSFGLEVRQAGNLLVLITLTSGAQPIAAAIDYEDYPEVVGTVAGDDTVLIICPGPKQAASLKSKMEEMIG